MTLSSGIDASTVISEARITRIHRLLIAAALLITVLDGYDVQSVSFTASTMVKEWGVPLSDFGIVFSAGLAGMLVGGLVLAPLADRFGRRRMILIEVAFFTLCTFSMTLVTSIGSASVLRFVTGLGLGAVVPSLVALVSEYAPERLRSTMVVLMVSGAFVGGFICGGLSAWLIPGYGWRSIFLAGGLLAVVIIVLALFWLPESIRYLVIKGDQEQALALVNRISPQKLQTAVLRVSSPDRRTRRQPVRVLFSGRLLVNTLLLWSVFFLNLLVTFFLISWTPALYAETSLGSGNAALASALLNLGAIAGGLLIGFLSDRLQARFIMPAIGYSVAAIFTAVVGFSTENPVLLLVATFFIGAGVGGSGSAVAALGAAIYPTAVRSTGLGWMYGVSRIGSIFGPAIGAFLIAAGLSPRGIFSSTLLPTVVGLAALLLLARRRPIIREDSVEPAGEL